MPDGSTTRKRRAVVTHLYVRTNGVMVSATRRLIDVMNAQTES